MSLSARRKRELEIRLNRIEGHVRGVRRLIQEDAPPDQVILQISAVRAALRQVAYRLVDAEAPRGGEAAERLRRSLRAALK